MTGNEADICAAEAVRAHVVKLGGEFPLAVERAVDDVARRGSTPLAETVAALLDAPGERQRLGANARRHVQENYDLKTVCLPARMRWVEDLME